MIKHKNEIRDADIYNENFNHYFVDRLNNMSPYQRNLMPKELSFKIFQRGNVASTAKLNFNERTWILSNIFEYSISIVISEIDGIGIKDFKNAIRAQNGEIVNSELLGPLHTNAAFILSDKDLNRSLLYMNHVCTSPIYSLVKKEVVANASNKPDKKFKDAKDRLTTVSKLLINYEANKRRMAMDFNIDPCKWLALLFFSTGEKTGVEFYNDAMRYSYNSAKSNLNMALNELYKDNYLSRRGTKVDYRYTLTSKGISLFNNLMDKIVMKFTI